jgi:DNA polymerase-3 subunit gamma/tau
MKKDAELALYRKYRPKGFAEVLGQEHVVSALLGALKNKKIAHAYLFSGSRGTGKTSVARILARELGTSDNDIYEIDAASNRGIDDIRELRDGVRTLPFDSAYKVYIIDEVHMLTKEAFNALLKTLEEPPAHVIFVLATTELEKVPDTIISRCQTFVFKRPTDAILKSFALDIAEKEGLTLSSAAAELIALLGDGSFRDTHGIIQKVGSTSGKKIDVGEIEAATGAPSGVLVNAFINAVASKELEKGIEAVHTAASQNIDMRLYLKLILQKIRLVLLFRFAPEMKKDIESALSETDAVFVKTIAADKSGAISSKTILELLDMQKYQRDAFIAELPLELALMRLIEEK